MADTADLSINNNQAEHTEGLNGEDIFHPSRIFIEDMAVATSIKKKNNPSQKDYGADLSGVILSMAVSMVSEKNKIKLNQ